MTTKNGIKLLLTSLLIAVFPFSCEKEESLSAPVVNNLEVGLSNSLTAFIGSDLHVEAEIVAEAQIDKIIIEIHSEDVSGEEIEVVYSEFSGLINTTLHKHVDIPAEMSPGSYHFHLTVVDKMGNTASVEREIELKTLEDEVAPILTVTESPANGSVFSDNEIISISGTLTDDNSLGGLFVALVYGTDNIADESISGKSSNVIVMLHTHDFETPKSHTFTASIKVGAEMDNNMTPAEITGENRWRTGEYYILIKGKDALNNSFTSNKYPVVIELNDN